MQNIDLGCWGTAVSKTDDPSVSCLGDYILNAILMLFPITFISQVLCFGISSSLSLPQFQFLYFFLVQAITILLITFPLCRLAALNASPPKCQKINISETCLTSLNMLLIIYPRSFKSHQLLWINPKTHRPSLRPFLIWPNVLSQPCPNPLTYTAFTFQPLYVFSRNAFTYLTHFGLNSGLTILNVQFILIL